MKRPERSSGSDNVTARAPIEDHWEVCLKVGLGVNAEVMLDQWEFQCFGTGSGIDSDGERQRSACRRVTVASVSPHRTTQLWMPRPISDQLVARLSRAGGARSVFWFFVLTTVRSNEYVV